MVDCFDSYPSCSGATAPGLAADMHFRDNVIAFVGPACAFALEPVARLAAYWNTPIITGMGDQVGIIEAIAATIRAVIQAGLIEKISQEKNYWVPVEELGVALRALRKIIKIICITFMSLGYHLNASQVRPYTPRRCQGGRFKRRGSEIKKLVTNSALQFHTRYNHGADSR